jgi:hypothetical protein
MLDGREPTLFELFSFFPVFKGFGVMFVDSKLVNLLRI